MIEPDAFFEGLTKALRSEILQPKRSTPTGWNVFDISKIGLSVTVNYVPARDRVAVKMTINRNRSGGSTHIFDDFKRQFENNAAFAGASWTSPPDKSESKVEMERTISSEPIEAHYTWIQSRAEALARYAREIK